MSICPTCGCEKKKLLTSEYCPNCEDDTSNGLPSRGTIEFAEQFCNDDNLIKKIIDQKLLQPDLDPADFEIYLDRDPCKSLIKYKGRVIDNVSELSIFASPDRPVQIRLTIIPDSVNINRKEA